jgi:hypothetical protein
MEFCKIGPRKNTFELEEIFHGYTLEELRNGSIFSGHKEVWSLVYGRCYTLEFKVRKAAF